MAATDPDAVPVPERFDITAGTKPINFAEDMGEGPRIVPVISKSDLVSYNNLFFKDTAGPSSTDRLTQALLSNSEISHRDRGSGAWTFKANTEKDLLAHVENGLADDIKGFSDVDSAEAILRSIDIYCLGKQWMYHVGKEKGEVIKPFMRQCIGARCSGEPTSSQPPIVVVELGTYCGYSAILLAMTVRKFAPELDFRVYSTEINANHLEIASSMIKMAKLDQYITLILLDPAAEALSDALERHIPQKKIDFLLMDHAKDLYLSDLLELEEKGFVKKGTHVVADNVVVSSLLEKYRDYVGSLAKQSVVETNMVEGKLEYTHNLKDGLELTIYLQDPPNCPKDS